jgi:adenylate kinase family enzyme
MPKVLILTGPGGSGKSTIAELLVERSNFVYLDGDNEDTEFFPNGNQWLSENSEQLRKAHRKILERTKNLVNKGKNVVIDYIIFGQYLEFLELFRKEFGDNLQIKVLFPSKNELIKRDKDRKCWTTGVDRIEAVHEEFNSIKDKIGAGNFIDTSDQTPEETFAMYFSEY